MKKHIQYILTIVFVTLSTSCTEKLYTTLDVLRPAKVTFPVEADKLLVINNSATQPAEYGHKTELLNGQPKNVRINTDSLSLFCVSALAEEISDKYFFKKVVLLQNSANNTNTYFSLKPLAPDTVKNLCSKYDVNVVLSLDRIKVIDKLTEYYLGASVYIDKPFVAGLDVNYETIWTLHYPPEDPKSSSLVFKDTLYWESESNDQRYIQKGLPDRYDAIIDGALYAGRNTVKNIVPWWDKADRYFFVSDNKQMKQAMDSIYVKNWDAAIGTLKDILSKSKNKYIKAKAANNLAICLEISGNVDDALDYAVISMSFFKDLVFANDNPYEIVSDYVNQLKVRQKDIKTLKVQLGEEPITLK